MVPSARKLLAWLDVEEQSVAILNEDGSHVATMNETGLRAYELAAAICEAFNATHNTKTKEA